MFARAGLAASSDPPPPDVKITSLADDSRKVVKGGCFVAVRGVERDGHDFVDAAARAGAAVVLVDRDVAVPDPVIRLRVEDTRVALARLAAAYHGLRDKGVRNPALIAVTGTNGKTTVAWLLRSILRSDGHQTALMGTICYDLVTDVMPAPLTTPGSLDLCRHLAATRAAGADYAVLEVSSHALDQRRTEGLDFTAGVFTNLSGDHLDYHGTMEAYCGAKRRLFNSLGRDAVAVINRDDPVADLVGADLRARVLTFGIQAPNVDVGARIEEVSSSGSRFVLRGRSFETAMQCALIGRHNIMNALAAAATAEALGIAPAAIRQGIERTPSVPGRLQRVDPAGCPISVLVDYAHTDDALRSVLQALRPLSPGRLVCVFGCGGDRDRAKRPRMAAVVESVADVAYVTSDNPRTENPQTIIDEILSGFGAKSRCRVEVDPDRRGAIERAIVAARPDDTVLIAGKGHEDYQLIGDRVLHFDDAEVARECLNRVALAGSAA